MNKKTKIIFLLGSLFLSSCGENKINYHQDYVKGYVYYKIPSEISGYQYIKQKELDSDLFDKSKEFFLRLINANFENIRPFGDGAQGTYSYNLVLRYDKDSDVLRVSKDSLDPFTSVYFFNENGKNAYKTNGYMTYEYYKEMFELIDEYEKILSDVEWELIEFHC